MKLGFEEHDVAAIVGGAKGIGFACARQFAAEGIRVAVLDVDPSVGDAAARLNQEFDVDAVGIVADVSKFNDILDGAAKIKERFGQCRHIVYAAGIGSGKYGFPFWNLAPDDWRNVLDVNLLGAVHVAHAFSPLLISTGRGSFLFVSSVAGQIGSQTDPPYSAAKAAIINFAQCAAKDLAEYNVRVNTICPGMVKTKLNQSVWQAWNDRQPPDQRQSYDDWAEEKIRRVAPLGRWQTPEDIAAMAVFLASPAAQNVTGQTINVDGGQVMHW